MKKLILNDVTVSRFCGQPVYIGRVVLCVQDTNGYYDSFLIMTAFRNACDIVGKDMFDSDINNDIPGFIDEVSLWCAQNNIFGRPVQAQYEGLCVA